MHARLVLERVDRPLPRHVRAAISSPSFPFPLRVVQIRHSPSLGPSDSEGLDPSPQGRADQLIAPIAPNHITLAPIRKVSSVGLMHK